MTIFRAQFSTLSTFCYSQLKQPEAPTKMLEDIVWSTDPSYGFLAVNWALTLISTVFTALVVSYINSKPPALKTIMDFVNVFFLNIFMAASAASFVIISLNTLLTDSGEFIAVAMSLLILTIGKILQLIVLSIVVLQVLCTWYPWMLESSVFETVYKSVVAVAIPSVSLMVTLGIFYLGFVPPVWYYLLRGQERIGSKKFVIRQRDPF